MALASSVQRCLAMAPISSARTKRLIGWSTSRMSVMTRSFWWVGGGECHTLVTRLPGAMGSYY